MRSQLQRLNIRADPAISPNGKFPLENTGLYLAYGLPRHDSEHKAKRDLLKVATQTAAPPLYRAAYDDWKAFVVRERWPHAEASLKHRLFLGLGVGSVLETNVTLHRAYGVPYIPGSALKGLARAYAECLVDNGRGFLSDRQLKWLFGNAYNDTTAAAGNLDFQDGWWIPENILPLCLEVDTPHHAEYHRTQGEKPATDFDDPTPLHHLAIQGRFLISIKGEPLAAQLALTLLAHGLRMWGIGGRVNADYGQFSQVTASVSLNEDTK